MRKVVLVLFMCTFAFALAPANSIKASGNVIDLMYENGLVYTGEDNGKIEVYELNSTKLLRSIEFDKIKDFTGDLVGAKIYSVDKIPNEDIFLATVQGVSFYRDIFIIKNGVKEKIIDSSAKLMAKKAKFIDKNHIIIGLLSNEIILYDVKNKKQIYRKSISQSQFSDFSLSEDKSKLASASESGGVALIEVKSGKILKNFNTGNVDNIYKVDYKKGKILSAGQDRRGIFYDVSTGNYDRYDGTFLIYACALSPDARYGALAINQNNDIAVYDLVTKNQISLLKGQKSTLNTIVFIDDTNLISGSDDKYIMIWSLK